MIERKFDAIFDGNVDKVVIRAIRVEIDEDENTEKANISVLLTKIEDPLLAIRDNVKLDIGVAGVDLADPGDIVDKTLTALGGLLYVTFDNVGVIPEESP